MKIILLALVLSVALAVGIYLAQPGVPPKMASIHRGVLQRLQARQAVPLEENGYPLLERLLMQGSTPELLAVRELADTFATQHRPTAAQLAAFERHKPKLDEAIDRPALVWPCSSPGNSAQLTQLVALRSLAMAYRAHGQPGSYRRCWQLGHRMLANESVNELTLATSVLMIALEPLQEQVAGGRLTRPGLRELQAFLLAHQVPREALVRATDYNAYEQSVLTDMLKKGQFQYPGMPATGPPTMLEAAWLDHQLRESNRTYLRFRPCFLEVVPFASKGLSARKSAGWLDFLSPINLPTLEQCTLQYRHLLDAQQLLLASLALQLDPEARLDDPRVEWDPSTRLLRLEDREVYLNSGRPGPRAETAPQPSPPPPP
ncbi:MAG: hypothetical protein AMXMBFR33_51400 [Candidatus Xenobia bacterium]